MTSTDPHAAPPSPPSAHEAVSATGSLEQAVAWRITRAARLLRLHLAGVLRPHGVTPEQYFLLYRLREVEGAQGPGGCTQGELVDRTLDDRPNVSRLLAGMERAGWIERRPDPDDRRAKRVHLTAAGSALSDTLLALAVSERQRLFGGLDAHQSRVLDECLTHLEARLVAVG